VRAAGAATSGDSLPKNRLQSRSISREGFTTEGIETMKLTRQIALAGAVLFALGGGAFAQDQSAAPPPGGHGGAFRAACGQDMQTYCSTAQSRQDRHACMQTNQDKLSATCKSFLASHMHGAPAPAGQ
jgi:hypothetical protein